MTTLDSKTNKIILTLVIASALLYIIVGCNRESQMISESTDFVSGPEHQLQANDADAVELNNPSMDEGIYFRAAMTEGLISFAMWDGRCLLGGGLPMNYDVLLAEGSLPIIFANRYTGEDISSTEEYSKGDIYLQFDENEKQIRFYLHNGELDAAYEPEAVPPGELLPWAGDQNYLTDGKSLFWEEEMDSATFAAYPPGPVRERFNIPSNDEARTRIYLVYRAVNEIMYGAGNILAEVPDSLDDYIALVGRPNPVSWTNPYTGQPMEEVPWVKVTSYYQTEESGDPMPEIDAPPYPDIDESELPGNYSYALGPSPVVEGENRAYAQFYFVLSDGSIAAYLAIGQGPQERILGSQGWADMARAAGWDG